jgi:hypothetical protein
MDGSPLIFRAEPEPAADVEIVVNFGMFASREATPAEIDDLATNVLAVVSHVTIEAVRRYELDREGEAAVHQVKVEASTSDAVEDAAEAGPLDERLLEVVDAWARRSIELRHAEVAEVDALP